MQIWRIVTGNVWGQNVRGPMSTDCPGGCPEKLSMGKNIPGKVWRNVQIPMKDYKSLHAAVVICATLVNTQTHTQRHIAFDRLYY